MSDRSSFTSEYIYDDGDYEIMHKAFADAGWGDDLATFQNVKPIVCGFCSGIAYPDDYLSVVDAVEGIKTSSDIRFVVVCEYGKEILVRKQADGTTTTTDITSDFYGARMDNIKAVFDDNRHYVDILRGMADAMDGKNDNTTARQYVLIPYTAVKIAEALRWLTKILEAVYKEEEKT